MIKVGLLGGSGLVGQTYQKLVQKHPLFELVFMPRREELKDLSKAKECEFIFSALPNEVAREVDPLYAQAGFGVFSSASCFRMERDIPLIIPEINPEHFSLIETQKKNRGWKGFIVSKPNCTLQGMLLPLFPLHKKYGLKEVLVTYLQSRSGAGKDFRLDESILPFIEGEEEKSSRETHKILGDDKVAISAQCLRVPVSVGHMATISAKFHKKPSLDEIALLWEQSAGVRYFLDQNRPTHFQDLNGGMDVSIGRLRSCPLMDIKFISLSHNLIRGAAGGGIATLEQYLKTMEYAC